MVVSVLLKIELGHTQISVPKIGIQMQVSQIGLTGGGIIWTKWPKTS